MMATLSVVLVANTAFVGTVVALGAPWVGPPLRSLGLAAGLPPGVVTFWWVPVVAALLAVSFVAQLRYVRQETLDATGAREVTAEDRPDLHGRVGRLARQADTTVPAVYVADSPVPNSLALDGGGEPALVVSEGLLETLEGTELDAVLAHELAHVENRDATVMTLASFLPALTSDRHSLLASLGSWAQSGFVWALVLVVLYVIAAVASGQNLFAPGYMARFVAGVVVVVVVGGVALGVFATATTVAARRLSRYREFAADRSAAALTGDPATLATTLTRLNDEAPSAPDRDKRATSSLQGLCLLPQGFHPAADATGDDEGFYVETRTHPPTEQRVARLREVAAER
jgi:heat shock protein HtpX